MHYVQQFGKCNLHRLLGYVFTADGRDRATGYCDAGRCW